MPTTYIVTIVKIKLSQVNFRSQVFFSDNPRGYVCQSLILIAHTSTLNPSLDVTLPLVGAYNRVRCYAVSKR